MKTNNRRTTHSNQQISKRMSNHKKTRRNRNHSVHHNEQQIVTLFLQMLNTVKLYHWKTSSFAQHKATDELYSNLNTNIDQFVETMLGKTGGRVNLTGQKTLPLLDYINTNDFVKEINRYKLFMQHLEKYIPLESNSDLFNIRDEILGNLNQFTYLLTFK